MLEVKKILKFSGIYAGAVALLTLIAGAVLANYFPAQTQSFFDYFKWPLDANPGAGQNQQNVQPYVSNISYEQAIIDAVREASPSVVSIIISKDLPVYEQYYDNPFFPQFRQKGTEKKEVGGGSGFIVSEDGMALTNKHVVSDSQADYTVLTNDGRKYPAKVLATDPVQDLAVIKIQNADKKFMPIKLGDSDGIQIGQTVIAIGNALGEFKNTVSVGIVSGLGRTISASGSGGFSETLEDIIQTDAAINSGNSGGPLLNLKGEVIGISTAMAQGAENIGFALLINKAKRDIQQVSATSKITYPFLGVRYTLVDDVVKEKYNLSVDYGAYVLSGSDGSSAVVRDSAADKAGVKEKDIILEINGEKITTENSMSKIISKYKPEDKVVLKILRGSEEQTLEATLCERT